MLVQTLGLLCLCLSLFGVNQNETKSVTKHWPTHLQIS